jgi:hypothetical protein
MQQLSGSREVCVSICLGRTVTSERSWLGRIVKL